MFVWCIYNRLVAYYIVPLVCDPSDLHTSFYDKNITIVSENAADKANMYKAVWVIIVYLT